MLYPSISANSLAITDFPQPCGRQSEALTKGSSLDAHLFCCLVVFATLAPIRHMSLTMCDVIISASSWAWLGVLIKAGLLLGGRGSLVPAGTCRTNSNQESNKQNRLKRRHCMTIYSII